VGRLRVVVTGMGAVSSIGSTVDDFWAGLMRRECGLRPLARLNAAAHRVAVGGEVKGMVLRPDTDEAVQMATAAALEAARQAGLDGAILARTAVSLGTNFGALSSLDRFLGQPAQEAAGSLFREGMAQGATDAVARAVGARGPRVSISLSCASGNGVAAAAVEMLRAGEAQAVLAGGYDAITEIAWSGLAAMRTMTNGALRPFDARRDGTLFSEGAGVLALETLDSALARGARPLAEILGAATDNNAFHMAHPDPNGEGLARAMRLALADGGVEPGRVDYVSAHGTGTKYNDKLETQALKSVLGPRARQIPVVSIKSCVGHAMGAASSLEAISAVCVLTRGMAPATIGLEQPDPDCDLDYVADGPRKVDARVAMCDSAGIGGPNAVLALGRWEGRP